MQVQDVITYNQQIVKRIKDKEIAKYFYDKDYGLLLRFLRTGPKTIKEIEEAYIAEGNEKSDKTLYRYIHTLEEAGLAVEAGKRIYTDEEFKNKSVSIFMRTAIVFFDDTLVKSEEEKRAQSKNTYKAYKLLLDLLEEDKSFTEDCVEEIIMKVNDEGFQLASELIQKADREVFSLLTEHDFTDINQFILNLAWLLMIYKKDFKKRMTTC
ncbi:MAG: hypothetical protein ACFFDW_08810 [Candidatus Thorarchaeota archaeon]